MIELLSPRDANTYMAPNKNGKFILQLEGTGKVASVSLNNHSYTLNEGNHLVSGAFYEFEISAVSDDLLRVLSDASVVRVLFKSDSNFI